MRHTIIFLVSLLCLADLSAAEISFSEKDKTVIYTHSLNIIQEYQRLINEMADYAISDPEAARSSSESFLELFVNRQVLVFNDLDPSYNLSPFYEAETYISNLMLWYPDGMKISLDFENAKVGEIIQHENEVFSLDLMLTKKIDGNYLNRTRNINSEEILFRIAFNKRTGGFSNYKIVGVRNTDASMIPDFNKNLDEVKSEEMDENDLFRVEEGMRAILQDYVNYISLLGDNEELEEDKEFYRTSFKNLFTDEDVRVYNDLTPDPEKTLLSIEEYLSVLSNDYPKGISNVSMPVDSAKIGKAIKTEEGDYYATVKADKFFSGNYQERQAFRDAFELNFRISFDKSGSAFTDFKIESVDIEADDFYQAEEGSEDLTLPSFEVTTISRKGLSAGFEGSYGISYYENKTINSLTLDFDNHSWESTPKYGMKAGANVYYFMNDHIGFVSGLHYNSYESIFSLNGLFTDDELSLDINNDRYNKIIYADYDSTVKVNQIAIPLLVNYTSGKPGSIGFFAEAGIYLVYNLSARYHATGNYQFYGFYPSHPPVTQTLYIEELGFYNEENINREGDLSISRINLSGYLSAGLNISLGYFSSLRIGPEILYGINNIDAGKNFTDIFGKPVIQQSTLLKKYSLKISYILKL
jgi:hypothetical protein